MFKFLLFTTIIVYALYKVMSFFFKIGAASQQFRNQQQQQQQYRAEQKRDKKAGGNIKGGEYVDYEEVK